MKRDRKNIWMKIGMAVLTVTLALGMGPFVGLSEAVDRDQHHHLFLDGTVNKVESETVFVKIDGGTTRTFSIKEMEAEMPNTLKPGDRVRLEIEEGNQIIDIDRIDAKGRASHPEDHKNVTGRVAEYDRTTKTVHLQVDEGRIDTYEMKDPAALKMANVKTGALVTMEIDEENRLVNDFLLK